MRPIIDTHLDLSWNAIQWDRDLTRPLAEMNAAEAEMTDHRARGRATVSLPEMRRGNVAVCLATVLSRAKPASRRATGFTRRDLDFPDQTIASAVGAAQVEYYRLLAQRGEITLISTAPAFREHVRRWVESPGGPIGVVIAMEGADPIVNPQQAQAWWDRGLRCVGLAHYGPHPYAFGTGSAGPVTPAGRELLKEFERLGMIVDLTHCAEPGFFETLECFSGRVLASHNMCRAIAPGDRQFSDDQLRALIERDAIIGMAFDSWMLVPNYKAGQMPRDATTLADVANHVQHIADLAGNVRNIAIGTDLDGGYGTEQTPLELVTIADVQRLADVLKSRGFSDADCDAIFYGNSLRFFTEALPPS
ncbi:MAG: membrane dipeptidase [Tepidisphaeraceae bacterium]